MKKILLTGGLGYVATNMYNYLTKNRQDVICDICDYRTGKPLAHEIKEEDFDYDYVIHLAALSGIQACEDNPVLALESNFLSANNIFKLALKKRVPVVFTSSQAAKDQHSSTYAFMKWACEQLAYYYNKKGGRNYVIRLSNLYGGDFYLDRKNTFIKQLITRYKNNKPFEIHGNGMQMRDFIHVNDVCKAIYKILEVLPEDKSPMDIGTGIGTCIIDVAKMFPDATIEFRDDRSSGVLSSIADTSIAKERIGFEAKISLEDTIKRYIKEFNYESNRTKL